MVHLMVGILFVALLAAGYALSKEDFSAMETEGFGQTLLSSMHNHVRAIAGFPTDLVLSTSAAPSTEPVGWLYMSLYQDAMCPSEEKSQFISGMATNTCLTNAFNFDNSTSNVTSLSYYYSCDSGGLMHYSTFLGLDCNPEWILESNSTELGCYTYALNDSMVSVNYNCTASSAVSFAAPYILNENFPAAGCNTAYEYQGILNNICLPVPDFGNASANFSYPYLYLHLDARCEGETDIRFAINDNEQCTYKGPRDTDDFFDSLDQPYFPYYTITMDDMVNACELTALSYLLEHCMHFVYLIHCLAAYVNTPTSAPTRAPTLSNTPMPSQPLSTGQKLVYSVSQVLSGMDTATYNADYDLSNEVLAETVAACMSGVSSSNVVVDSIADASSTSSSVKRSSSRRQLRSVEIASSGVLSTYTVTIPNTAAVGYTSADQAYAATTASLNASLASGAFTSTMQSTAFSMGATAMESASSDSATASAPTVLPVDSGSSSSNDSLSGGAIAGIVIASLVVVGILCGIAYYCLVFVPATSTMASAAAADGPAPSAPSAPRGEENGVELGEIVPVVVVAMPVPVPADDAVKAPPAFAPLDAVPPTPAAAPAEDEADDHVINPMVAPTAGSHHAESAAPAHDAPAEDGAAESKEEDSETK